MFGWINKTMLMLAMAIAGLGLMVTPALVDLASPSAVLSSGIIGALMVVVGVGFGFGSIDWWSRFALGIGTWSMVAPVLLGFYAGGAGFWAHIGAGLVGLLCGVAGHELIGRQRLDAGGA